MMTEEEVYEYAKTHPAIGISMQAFTRAGVDPASLIGKSPAEQRSILHRVASGEMSHYGGAEGRPEPRTEGAAQGATKEPIDPTQAAINEQLLDKLTAELGRPEEPEEWRPGTLAYEEPFDDEDLQFMKELSELQAASKPIRDFTIQSIKKEAEKQAAYSAAREGLFDDPARRERERQENFTRLNSKSHAEQVAVAGFKPGVIEEV